MPLGQFFDQKLSAVIVDVTFASFGLFFFLWFATARCKRFSIRAMPEKAIGTMQDCKRACGRASHVAAPRSLTEFECLNNLLHGEHHEKVWIGLLERDRVSLGRHLRVAGS